MTPESSEDIVNMMLQMRALGLTTKAATLRIAGLSSAYEEVDYAPYDDPYIIQEESY